MATLRNKRKLAVIVKKSQKEHFRNSQSRDTTVLRNHEDFITQVLEKLDGRMRKKLSQEFSRRETRFLGALSKFKLDAFVLNLQVQVKCGTVPGENPMRTFPE